MLTLQAHYFFVLLVRIAYNGHRFLLGIVQFTSDA